MYPFVRLIWQMFKSRNDPPLPWNGTHVSHHLCLPWDLDLWGELNNGRTLTIFDMGRGPLARRAGLVAVLRTNKWGLTMAGVSVRYRRRIRMFERIEMHSRCVGWDDKFVYLDQSLWVKGQAASQALYRSAVTDRNGIVAPDALFAKMGGAPDRPEMPAWVQAWIAAEAERPWPPEA